LTIFTWNNADFTWNQSNPSDPLYTWNDVALIKEAIGGGGVITEDMPWMKWDDTDERKKKLIKLILKVHGNTITESKQKEIKEYKIKATDIKLAIKKITNVGIVTENIKL
tara:strand:- start:105 stop:434 length:330 start_codon:yes stop_codon:yes gene_type:complete